MRVFIGIVVLLLGMAGCAVPETPDPAAGAGGAPGAAAGADEVDEVTRTVRVAAVGDSITHGRSPEFVAGELSERSWVPHATGGGVELVGGWALGGATTADMVEHVTPVDADVLVVLAGTNDVLRGLTAHGYGPTVANLVEIVRIVGADEVVLSAIPPLERRPAQAAAFNVALEELAVEEGWHWVDGSASLRDGSEFAAGMSADGIHPTPEAAALLGEALREAVLDAAHARTAPATSR